MYQLATTILTLTSLAGHALFGCCAHHAHSVPSTAVVITDNEADAHREGASHCCAACGTPEESHNEPLRIAGEAGSHDSDTGCGSHGHKEAPCDAETCNYLGPDLVKVPDASGFATAVSLIPATARLGGNACALSRDRVDSDACTAGYRGGARIHELMAVWLL